MSKFTWTDEVTQTLTDAVAGIAEVSQEKLTELSESLNTTTRSVGAKLRKLGFAVQSASVAKKSAWSEEEESALASFLNENAGVYTYGEVAATILGGKFNAKQVQGKVLSMELTAAVKATPKKEVVRTYTDAQEAAFVEMANGGAFLEAIATALGKTVPQVRGKALSLFREGKIAAIPKQETVAVSKVADAFANVAVEENTVAELAALTGHSERGIRTMLTRRGLVAKDYDGAARKTKQDAKKTAE